MNTERNIISQYAIVYGAFYKGAKTMFQVARETRIERANICRIIAKLKDKRMVYPLRRGLCPISKNRATFYTTSPGRAWNAFTLATKTSWQDLNQDDTIAVWTVIREYVNHYFDEASVQVPASISEVWREIKPQIDREAIR